MSQVNLLRSKAAIIDLEHNLLPAHGDGRLPGQPFGLQRLLPGQIPRRGTVPGVAGELSTPKVESIN